MQCCADKCVTTSYLGGKKTGWFTAFSNFSGVNTPTMTDLDYECVTSLNVDFRRDSQEHAIT